MRLTAGQPRALRWRAAAAIAVPVRRAARRLDPWPLCAVLLALLPLLALLQPGLPNTADGQVHLLRTLEATRLLRAGILYPRWAPDFYLGYGYPFFEFYAGGAHMLAAWLALAGLGALHGLVAVQALALVLYPLGAYLAARSLLAGWRGPAAAAPAALVSAALYLYAPLRWRELFVQGNLSQLLALAWLPWCAWLLAETVRHGGRRRVALAAGALAALLYLHHPSAFLGYPALGLYALALALVEAGGSRPRLAGLWRRLGPVAAAFALALALGAPFWLPALVEMRAVNLNAIDSGSFNAGLNLLPLREILALPAIQDGAALNPPMPNSLGSAQALLALIGLLAALWLLIGRPKLRPASAGEPVQGGWSSGQAGAALLALAGLLGGSVWLMLPLAAPLWRALPLARLIAFPWRLLGPALLFAALLGGAWVALLPGRLRLAVTAACLALIPLALAPYLFPRPFVPQAEPQLSAIARFELAGGPRGTASANEYLPRWVRDADPPAVLAADYLAGRDPQRLDPASLPAGARYGTSSSGALSDTFWLDLPAAATVQVLRFFFPGWQAWVDGRPAAASPSQPYGLIQVSMPAGQHELRLSFGSTPLRRAAGWAGALALAGCAALCLWPWRRALATREAAGQPARKPALGLGLVSLLVTALLAGVVGPHTDWFRRTSPVAAPAGMQHALHARFANGVELLGYDLPQAAVRQGGSLAVRLYWRPLTPGATNAHPFLHLDAITGEVTWAAQVKLNAGDKPMASWVPGFYVVDDYELPVPEGTPPVVAALRAGLLANGQELVPLAAGGDVVTLGQVRVRESRPLSAAGLPGHMQPYRLGPNVRLAGYESHRAAGQPALELTLYWQALAPVLEDYTVFVHVSDASGKQVAGRDGQPLDGWYPTSAWLPGQIVVDRRSVPLPAGSAASANLRVTVGLYTLADGQRAPVTDLQGARQPNDEILLP